MAKSKKDKGAGKGFVAKKKAKKNLGVKKIAQKAAKKGAVKAKAKAKVTCPIQKSEIPALAKKWAAAVDSSKPWIWNDIKPGLSDTAKSNIRNYARDHGLVEVVPLDKTQKYNGVTPKPGCPFVKFPAKYIAHSEKLPKDMLLSSDTVQFNYLSKKLAAENSDFDAATNTFKNNPKLYTWHHDQDPPGQMRLVEFGIHNVTSHSGGRNVWGGGTEYR